MRITFELDLEAAEREALSRNLGIADRELPAAVNKIGRAAVNELIGMATARETIVLSTESATKRLENLIRFFYENRLPTESEVARVFQIQANRARAILANLWARRRDFAEPYAQKTIVAILRAAKTVEGKDDLELRIQSPFIIELIKELIERHASGFDSISKKRGSIDVYDISVDTFNRIAAPLGVPPQQPNT